MNKKKNTIHDMERYTKKRHWIVADTQAADMGTNELASNLMTYKKRE